MERERKITAAGGKAAQFSKIGDEVSGLYVGKQYDANGKYGPTNKHLLKTKEGVTVVYAKPGSQLDDLFEGETGKFVWVTYTASVPSTKGNPRKVYVLDRAKGVPALDSEELPTFAANAEDEEQEVETEDDEDQQQYEAPAPVAKAAATRRAQLDALLKSKKD
jgi:hypothetical protein